MCRSVPHTPATATFTITSSSFSIFGTGEMTKLAFLFLISNLTLSIFGKFEKKISNTTAAERICRAQKRVCLAERSHENRNDSLMPAHRRVLPKKSHQAWVKLIRRSRDQSYQMARRGFIFENIMDSFKSICTLTLL